MRIDPTTFFYSQRMAIDRLNKPFIPTMGPDGQIIKKKNDYLVAGNQITAPVTLVQELPFLATNNTYTFDFTSNAPAASSTLNNVLLPKNNVAAIYAIQVLLGHGATANNRDYYSHGFTVDDNSLYNSNMAMQIEDQTKINLINGQEFRDVYDSPLAVDSLSGVCMINPIRILSGNMGIWNVTITLNQPITALKLTSNLFVSCRLRAVMGQASGQPTK